MSRRVWLLLIAGLLAWVMAQQHSYAQGDTKTLRVVPHSNLTILDPIWTTAYITRNHGYMIYDTLFGMDAKGSIQPQMVDKWEVSKDRKPGRSLCARALSSMTASR